MPIPKPRSGEKKEDFLSRCMANSTMNKEFPESDQRYAVCQSQLAKRFDPSNGTIQALTKDDEGFERIVFAEVLIPDAPNTYGDYHTKESIREFAYGFMINGFRKDINHDNVDRQDLYVIESFIAREGDPTFVEGSWVVGMYVEADDVWEKILSGELNGYSYEALVSAYKVDVQLKSDNSRYGVTEPDPYDGHTHEFFVWLDDEGKIMFGGTSASNGHSHTISMHTVTDSAFEHTHRYNFVVREGDR